MKNRFELYTRLKRQALGSGLAFLCLMGLPVFLEAQSATTIQNLSFGAFTQSGSGGTVTVSNQGLRSATGSVILLNLGQIYQEALIDVPAPAGTTITVTNGPDVTLTGSNGGTMTLQLGPSFPASPFSADPSGTTRVSIGGTLTVGNSTASPPGNYSGTFSITFNYQ